MPYSWQAGPLASCKRPKPSLTETRFEAATGWLRSFTRYRWKSSRPRLPTFKKSTPHLAPLYCSHCQIPRGISKAAIGIDGGLPKMFGGISSNQTPVSRDRARSGPLRLQSGTQKQTDCTLYGVQVSVRPPDLSRFNRRQHSTKQKHQPSTALHSFMQAAQDSAQALHWACCSCLRHSFSQA